MADFSDLRDIFNAENNSDETKFTLKTILQAPDPTVSNQSDDRRRKMNDLSLSLTFQIFFCRSMKPWR